MKVITYTSPFSIILWMWKYLTPFPGRYPYRSCFFTHLTKWQILMVLPLYFSVFPFIFHAGFVIDGPSRDDGILNKISFLLIHMYSVTLFHHTMYHKKKFWALIADLEELFNILQSSSKSYVRKMVRRYSVVSSLTLFSLFLISYIEFAMFEDYLTEKACQYLHMENENYCSCLLLLSFPMSIWVFMLCMFYLFLLLSLVLTIIRGSEELQQEITTKLQGMTSLELTHFKTRHQNLTDLVLKLDDVFGVPLFLFYVLSLASLCLGLTGVILQENPTINKYIYVISRYTTTVIGILYISLKISSLSQSFQRIQPLAQKIILHPSHLELEALHQNTAFILQSSVEVGITGCGCFVINKKFVLSLFSVLGTYTIFALQVKSISL